MFCDAGRIYQLLKNKYIFVIYFLILHRLTLLLFLHLIFFLFFGGDFLLNNLHCIISKTSKICKMYTVEHKQGFIC